MVQGTSFRKFLISIGFLLTAFGANSFAQVFNGGSITLNGTNDGQSNSVGSNSATVSLSGTTVTAISVSFSGLNFGHLGDLSFVLVSPGGVALELISATCDAGNSTFTLADNVTAGTGGPGNNNGMLPSGGGCPVGVTSLSGSYLPTVNVSGDSFNSPGPGTSYTSPSGATPLISKFGHTVSSMNGVWKLFAANQATPAADGMLQGWSITFTTSGLPATTTNLSAPNPTSSFTTLLNSSVSLTATVTQQVGGAAVTSGNVQFRDNLVNIGSSAPVNGSGVATASVTFTTEGTHSVDAVYLGNGSFAGSAPSNSQTETVRVHTTQTVNGSVDQECINSTITINDGNFGTGLGVVQYPTQLTLGSGSEPTLTGIIQKLTVTLNGITYDGINGLGFMLVAPGGQAYEFMSAVGGTTANPNLTLTLDDSSANTLQQNTVPASGTYKPVSDICNPGCNTPPDPYPSPAPQIFSSAAPFGSSTFLQKFGGLGTTGTWNLFIANRATIGSNGTMAGWCLNFTMQTNAPPTTTDRK